MKKSLLVVLPILPKRSDAEPFVKSLSFLNAHYDLHFLDPMDFDDGAQSSEDFYKNICNHLADIIENYSGFIGFSLGALCLLRILKPSQKPFIMFSTPTGFSQSFEEKFKSSIINLRTENYQLAFEEFVRWVYFPAQTPIVSELHFEDCLRLARGLLHVCNWNFEEEYLKTDVLHWHFVGEASQLVTPENILKPVACRVVSVPHVGMRILENAPKDIQAKILACLA